MSQDEGQYINTAIDIKQNKPYKKATWLTAVYRKLKTANKRKLVFIFVGFLLLKLFIVSVILLFPRVVELIRA